MLPLLWFYHGSCLCSCFPLVCLFLAYFYHFFPQRFFDVISIVQSYFPCRDRQGCRHFAGLTVHFTARGIHSSYHLLADEASAPMARASQVGHMPDATPLVQDTIEKVISYQVQPLSNELASTTFFTVKLHISIFPFSFACDFSGSTCRTFSPLFSCFMWVCKAVSSVIILTLQCPSTFLVMRTAFGVLKPSFDLSLNITLNKWHGGQSPLVET